VGRVPVRRRGWRTLRPPRRRLLRLRWRLSPLRPGRLPPPIRQRLRRSLQRPHRPQSQFCLRRPLNPRRPLRRLRLRLPLSPRPARRPQRRVNAQRMLQRLFLPDPPLRERALRFPPLGLRRLLCQLPPRVPRRQPRVPRQLRAPPRHWPGHGPKALRLPSLPRRATRPNHPRASAYPRRRERRRDKRPNRPQRDRPV
jgi:hypothetical protein